jgi:hypothetical protein
MTDELSLPASVQYGVDYIPIFRTCKCGKKYRVDCADGGVSFATQLFQHCPEDEGHYLPGPRLGAYEEREGKWVALP